jgi:hypothetical protein
MLFVLGAIYPSAAPLDRPMSRIITALLRWWYIHRASAMLHKRIWWELRAEVALSHGDQEKADAAYEKASRYRIRDFAYQLRLKQICPDVHIAPPPHWTAHEEAWRSGDLP